MMRKMLLASVALAPVWLSAQTAVEPAKSRLEVIAIASGLRKVVYETTDHIEAPNWSRDGKMFLFNKSGRLYTLPRAGGQPRLLDTGMAVHCNNDHGLSPDGKSLVVS